MNLYHGRGHQRLRCLEGYLKQGDNHAYERSNDSAHHVIKPDTPVLEAALLMRDDDLGALPVAENERLIGMLTDRDIVVRVVAEGKNVTTPVRQILTEKLLYCFEDEPIEKAAENMSKNQVRRLPVLNRDKRLVGIISLGDLALQGGTGKSAEALRGVSKPTH